MMPVYGFRFWISPKGKIYKSSLIKDDTLHFEMICKILNIDKEQAIKNAIDPQQEALKQGYCRGSYQPSDELDLEVQNFNDAEKFLNILNEKMPETMFVEALVINNKEVEVDEDEDALKAWRNRNSIRKRSSMKLSSRDNHV